MTAWSRMGPDGTRLHVWSAALPRRTRPAGTRGYSTEPCGTHPSRVRIRAGSKILSRPQVRKLRGNSRGFLSFQGSKGAPMALDTAAVAARVSEELAQIADKHLANALGRYIIRPRSCSLQWDYGPEEQYPGFVVAEFHESETGIAYSDFGFGPSQPWILIGLRQPAFGMDSSAFTKLEGAFRESRAWDEPPPPGYEVE